MRRIMLLACLFSFILLFAGIGLAEEKTYLLKLQNDKSREVLIKFEANAKTKMAMLFMPEIETFLRFNVDQINSMHPQDKDGRIICESRVATASLEYYMPGQPNQSMNDSMIDNLLWVSGLGGREVTITALRDSQGNIASVTGVPDEYASYYKYDLFFYPDKPVKIGESWKRTITQPMPVDLNQPPYDLEITGTYTLTRMLKDEKEAEIAFRFEAISDHAMQAGKNVKVDVKLIREGKMVMTMADGFPVSIKSKTTFDFIFSANNYIKSEEEYSSSHSLIEEKAGEGSNK